jgi:hypothetical protein
VGIFPQECLTLSIGSEFRLGRLNLFGEATFSSGFGGFFILVLLEERSCLNL